MLSSQSLILICLYGTVGRDNVFKDVTKLKRGFDGRDTLLQDLECLFLRGSRSIDNAHTKKRLCENTEKRQGHDSQKGTKGALRKKHTQAAPQSQTFGFQTAEN